MAWVRVARQFAVELGGSVSHRLRRIPLPPLSGLLPKIGVAPTVLCAGMLFAFPTQLAWQDMASLVSGIDRGGPRWNAAVEKPTAVSVEKATLPLQTGARVAGAAMSVPGFGAVSFKAKRATADTSPDEDRVTRADKKGRVIQVVPVAPPKAFNAGSVLDRTSSLLRPAMDEVTYKLVFARPKQVGKEIELATVFKPKREKPVKSIEVPDYLLALVNNDAADVLAAAYAPKSGEDDSPFSKILREDVAEGRFIPPLGKGDHKWLQTPLPATVFSAKEQQCLANAVYFEARGESLEGQAAVAQVVLNRVRNPTYPKTICGVVYQNDGWFNRCQFSFACDGVKDRIDSPGHYRKAQEVARAVTSGQIFLPQVGSSTHYYAEYVSPGWARTMKRMTKIGQHIFYRTVRGGWS